tara:strand:- start:1262 stop:2407 length:1146 start_codon:yes stop_codon:yes gene_type:complete
MGFQVGTKVDPRLMAVDYSPLIRANEMAAESIANMGKQIGDGIQKYKKKKEDKDNEDGMVDFLVQTGAFGDATPDEIRKGVKGAGGGSNLLGMKNVIEQMLNAAEDRPGDIAQKEANLASTEAGTAATVASTGATKQSTEQSASAFPTDQAIREQSLLRQEQLYDQSASLFPTQSAMANLGLDQAQQDYDQNKAMNPGRLESQNIMNQNALQAFDIAGQSELRNAMAFGTDQAATKQNIAASIASVNNAQKTLEMEQRKLALKEQGSQADEVNAQLQADAIQMVLDGTMSNPEYIKSGGDMDALRKAIELTEGQTPRGNADMIAAITQINSNLRYNPETNDWTDTSYINEDGIQWSDPRIQNILGTRESQVMGNAGWSIPE